MIEYIVNFIAGSRVDDIHVFAHDEKQARELARMQVRYGRKMGGKFEILSVRKEGEEDPILKELDKYKIT